MSANAEEPRDPLALAAYEALADRYAERIDDKPHNAHYDRPAVLSLLPDVAGAAVLDAGCGPGAYAEILVERGARVTAVDVSPRMVEHARRRLGDRVEVRLADLEQPLPFDTGAFDGIVAPLSLDYLRDLAPVYREFRRVLRHPGWMVFSTGHPFGDFQRHPHGAYFESRVITETWTGFGAPVNVPFHRRPLQDRLIPLFEAGFVIDLLIEPLPTEEFRRRQPRSYETVLREPGFLAVRARTSPA